MTSEKPYNPLEKTRIAESVVSALLQEELRALPLTKRFNGAGLYAIYYLGGLEMYAPISIKGHENEDAHRQTPIYVGEAIPKGARKGLYGLETQPGSVLYSRVNQHARSIEQTANLSLVDFKSRYLVVDDIWIPLAESLLIQQFKPIWNVVIDGFGNHDPGKGRYNQKRSPWDVLHPGREWADKCQPSEYDATYFEQLVHEYFTQEG